MCVFGSERVWKPGIDDQHLLNRTSGTIDIQAFLTWMEQHGYLPTGSTWTAGSYGFEICDTGGTNETFRVNAFYGLPANNVTRANAPRLLIAGEELHQCLYQGTIPDRLVDGGWRARPATCQ